MGAHSVEEIAAISRIAALLEKHLTNGIIDAVCGLYFRSKLDESSKVKKLRRLLSELHSDARARTSTTRAIYSLVTEAHQRTTTGAAHLSVDDVDAIVCEMRVLHLDTAQLAKKGWRKGLHGNAARAVPVAEARVTAAHHVAARRHEDALQYLMSLDGEYPQRRGLELEKILTSVALAEGLDGRHNVVNPGEQIDSTFVLEGSHYLTECRWTSDVQGAPAVRGFMDKVRRKAEGTFGVFVSMSGFTQDINETVAAGARLNSIGLTHNEVMDVLEGRNTWSEAVRAGRGEASRRGTFYRRR